MLTRIFARPEGTGPRNLRRFVAWLGAGALVTAALLGPGMANVAATQGGSDGSHKVTICHRTNSVTNPYVEITVDYSAADGGLVHDNGDGDHTGHTGPVFDFSADPNVAYPPPHNGAQWGDIIPPYTWPGDQSHAGGSYPGLNWTTDGQAIWSAGCGQPSSTTSTSSSSSSSTACSTSTVTATQTATSTQTVTATQTVGATSTVTSTTTLTSTKTETSTVAGGTQTETVTATVTADPVTVTQTVTATVTGEGATTTRTVTLPGSTVVVPGPGVTSTVTLPGSTVTVTKSGSTTATGSVAGVSGVPGASLPPTSTGGSDTSGSTASLALLLIAGVALAIGISTPLFRRARR